MASELERDPQYIEVCRIGAWSSLPVSKVLTYWDDTSRGYRFPEGWPEGVDPKVYVRSQIDQARPAGSSTDIASIEGPVSPSVERLRKLIGGQR